MSTPLGGHGDNDYDNDVRWEEQGMPYLYRDRQRAEGGEGDVDNGVDDEHLDGRVRDCSKGAVAWSLGQKVVLCFNGYWGKRSE